METESPVGFRLHIVNGMPIRELPALPRAGYRLLAFRHRCACMSVMQPVCPSFESLRSLAVNKCTLLSQAGTCIKLCEAS